MSLFSSTISFGAESRSSTPKGGAHLVFDHGQVWTDGSRDPSQKDPFSFKPGTIATKDDRLLVVGSRDQALAYKNSSTKLIGLNGGWVVPSFYHGRIDGVSVLARGGATPQQERVQANTTTDSIDIDAWRRAGYSTLGLYTADLQKTLASLVDNAAKVKSIPKLPLSLELWVPAYAVADFLKFRRSFFDEHTDLRPYVRFAGLYKELPGGNKPWPVDDPLVQELVKMVHDANAADMSVSLRCPDAGAAALGLTVYSINRKTLFNSRVRNRLELQGDLAEKSWGRLAELGVVPVLDSDELKSRNPHAGRLTALVNSGAKYIFGNVIPSSQIQVRPWWEVWSPKGILSLSQALKGATVHGAYSGHEEHARGTLREGKKAEFVVFSKEAPFKEAAKSEKTPRLELLYSVYEGTVLGLKKD